MSLTAWPPQTTGQDSGGCHSCEKG
ncbi:hypothetical protein AAFC00_001967 [Neodothiora populina]|uniref:Uncharacterized protein n=1 Tax=Neodothiora populina TaxID=2781224 RepID=A0ABR3PQQ9_9PEZI